MSPENVADGVVGRQGGANSQSGETEAFQRVCHLYTQPPHWSGKWETSLLSICVPRHSERRHFVSAAPPPGRAERTKKTSFSVVAIPNVEVRLTNKYKTNSFMTS